MEYFFDPKSNEPLSQITVAQGETKVVGIKKFDAKDVNIETGDIDIAFVSQVLRLKDPTKKSYDNKLDYYDILSDKSTAVEKNGSVFFQICGHHAGRTALIARFKSDPNGPPYAMSLGISVTDNKKLLTFNPSKPFLTLWANHPANPANKADYMVSIHGQTVNTSSHPCYQAKWLVGQCMIRFCTTLYKSGVRMDGLHGNKCGYHGSPHDHHFINPYDFETWKGHKDAYVWEAKPPFELEPMPGIAAHQFTHGKRGVILFKNYFPTGPHDMGGGHIDLWNYDRMGNTYMYADPDTGQSAFLRSHKIVFWPLETV